MPYIESPDPEEDEPPRRSFSTANDAGCMRSSRRNGHRSNPASRNGSHRSGDRHAIIVEDRSPDTYTSGENTYQGFDTSSEPARRPDGHYQAGSGMARMFASRGIDRSHDIYQIRRVPTSDSMGPPPRRHGSRTDAGTDTNPHDMRDLAAEVAARMDNRDYNPNPDPSYGHDSGCGWRTLEIEPFAGHTTRH